MANLYDWKDMSTAPKDGTFILGYVKDINDAVVCFYENKDDGWMTCGGSLNLNVIRWCHLPKHLAKIYNEYD